MPTPTYIHTFTAVAGGSPKMRSTKKGDFETSNGKRPVFNAFGTTVLRLETINNTSVFTFDIDLTSERVIVDNTATGGALTTYNSGDITASALHDVLNVFYQVNVLMP